MHTLVKPVFLVGAMRSGTTLLADLLGESRQIIHCPFELKDIWSNVGGVPMACPKTRDEICQELTAKDVQPGQRERLTAAFIERMVVNSSGKAADAVFLNKNPHLCNKLPFVDALFPDARFIWIYRQLPSVVTSLYALFENVHRLTQTWHYWPESQSGTTNRCWQAFHCALPDGIDQSRCFPGGEVQYLVEYWLESNRAVSEFFNGLPPERRYVIQEEALIESPCEQLEGCLAFLGVSPFVRPDICESVDSTRNSAWGQKLNDQALEQLLEFVEERAQIIDDVFPGRNYAKAYMREIQVTIDCRKEAGTNLDHNEANMSPPDTSLINDFIKGFAEFFSFRKTQARNSDKQLIIGCVAENTPKYLSQALRLLQSVRWFGGEMADTKFIVCVIEEVDSAYEAEFQKYSAEVRIVKRFSKKHPPSNKLRFLQQPDLKNYQHVLLLDCDTIVVQDPTSYLQGEGLRAKIADAPTVPTQLFKKLFNFFHLPLPREDYHCTVTGTPTIPYFNAGVLLFSQSAMAELVPIWIKLNEQLIENMELLENSSFFCEQASLSLALASVGTYFDTFDNAFNFPIHFENSFHSLEGIDPIIIHYHDKIELSGNIKLSHYAPANDRITQFNKQLREERENLFDNKLFWNSRYVENPDLGSGIGSRGVCRDYKRTIIKNLADSINISSILDVGCGDMEVSSILPATGYIGIDVSDVVISKNRELYPDRSFISGDFLSIELMPVDLVVCMDVLIHISDYEYYKNFLDKLVRLTKNVGIVSGYETDPRCKGIVFYHEPLTVTLEQLGAKQLCKVGSYMNTEIWSFRNSRFL